jgi:hypothetical protein
MKQAEATQLLQDEFDNDWPVLQPSASYAFENESFRGAPPLWALMFIRHTLSKQVTMGRVGSRKFEHDANVIVMLFGDVEQGRRPIDTAVASVHTIFRARFLVSGVAASLPRLQLFTARSAETGKNGKTTDGLWFQHQVTIPFRYHELA